MAAALHIALAGNPNAGKTTLFNFLTGARQHVGNYPGVTVEKKEGAYSHEGRTIRIVDLPGTYSLTAYSVEELVARDYLVNEQPDVVVNVVDASNLERNLYLSCQFLELGVPLVIALNMIDVAEKRGISIDTEKLSELTGVPVIPLIARSGKGVPELLQTVRTVSQSAPSPRTLIRYGAYIDAAIRDLLPL
ncbi:MAG: GTP-binding protein, partial [Candidatus Electrothrix sp. AUS1_2]|nr:GTP-binding protein [Candidatus Electrothrix sp. AUS1_2]